MIVAITGGTGFIGKNLVARLLARGDTVRLLTRCSEAAEKSSLLEIHECDLLTVDADELSAMLDGVDVLYHCAGQLKDVRAMRTLHVGATRKLAEAASRHVSHWVQLSSVGVYGPVSRGVITEDSELNPVGEYEITKAASDKIVIEAANKGGFSYSILRPSNVFGSGMTNQSLFDMITMIDRGLFIYIGKPGASANYIHVSNVVEGMICCGTMHSAKGGTYNLSDHCTFEKFVSIIVRALNKDAPGIRLPDVPVRLVAKWIGKLPGIPLTEARVNVLTSRAVYSTEKIERELDYCYRVTMEEGLLDLIASWKQKKK